MLSCWKGLTFLSRISAAGIFFHSSSLVRGIPLCSANHKKNSFLASILSHVRAEVKISVPSRENEIINRQSVFNRNSGNASAIALCRVCCTPSYDIRYQAGNSFCTYRFKSGQKASSLMLTGFRTGIRNEHTTFRSRTWAGVTLAQFEGSNGLNLSSAASCVKNCRRFSRSFQNPFGLYFGSFRLKGDAVFKGYMIQQTGRTERTVGRFSGFLPLVNNVLPAHIGPHTKE